MLWGYVSYDVGVKTTDFTDLNGTAGGTRRAAARQEGTAEDAEIRVICVICGLLGCPQITQKTQRIADYET